MKRLDDAAAETLLSTSVKNLRAQIVKPFPSTPTIISLKTIVDREEHRLAEGKKDYEAVVKEINFLLITMFPPTDGCGNQGAKEQLDQALVAKVTEFNKGIEILGNEEIKELEKEEKIERKKRAKIAEFFVGLDEE